MVIVKRKSITLSGVLFLLLSIPMIPASGLASSGVAAGFERRVVEFRLPNGMKWMLVRQAGAPVFTGTVYVKVGGIEEEPGKTGLAHMFEHMAFKGTSEIGTKDYAKESELYSKIRDAEKKLKDQSTPEEKEQLKKEIKKLSDEARQYIVPNEIWHLFHKNGAEELNAFTGKDVTGYYARMPSNMTGLWVYLASQMVGHPVLREFYQERSVVMEERRSSTDASPRGKLYEALLQAAYTKSPYRWMTIGSMNDLNNLTLTDAEAFHEKYYRPDRMVGAIVGSFDLGEAKANILRFFGSLHAKLPSPPGGEGKGEGTVEPPQMEKRRVKVEFDAQPSLMMAFHKPGLPHMDDYVFDVIVTMLCDNTTSRLEKRLVQDERIARSVDCESGSPGGRLDNLFLIGAQPIAPHTVAELEAVIEEELAKLRSELVSEDELAMARTNIESDFLWGISTNEGLAQQLAYFQALAGDWRYILRHGDMMGKITLSDIQRVANKYLLPANETVAELVHKR